MNYSFLHQLSSLWENKTNLTRAVILINTPAIPQSLACRNMCSNSPCICMRSCITIYIASSIEWEDILSFSANTALIEKCNEQALNTNMKTQDSISSNKQGAQLSVQNSLACCSQTNLCLLSRLLRTLFKSIQKAPLPTIMYYAYTVHSKNAQYQFITIWITPCQHMNSQHIITDIQNPMTVSFPCFGWSQQICFWLQYFLRKHIL